MVYLMGLNEDHAQIRSQVLMMEHFQQCPRFYLLLLRMRNRSNLVTPPFPIAFQIDNTSLLLISSLRIAKGIVFNALIVVYLAHYWLLFQDSWLPLGYPKKSKENPPFDPAVVSHTSNIPSSIGSSSTLSQEQCQLLICSLSSQML